MLVTTLAAINTSPGNGLHLICVILLIATIIALVVGLAEAIGLGFIGNRLGGSRFGPLVLGVILLIVYIVLCN